MLHKPKCPVIALEEHYWDHELAAHFAGAEGVRDPQLLERLYDVGELRLREMDDAGIDMQVLSHGAPSAQKLSGPNAVPLTRRVNDRLHAVVTANPKRFAAFAALPMPPIQVQGHKAILAALPAIARRNGLSSEIAGFSERFCWRREWDSNPR